MDEVRGDDGPGSAAFVTLIDWRSYAGGRLGEGETEFEVEDDDVELLREEQRDGERELRGEDEVEATSLVWGRAEEDP